MENQETNQELNQDISAAAEDKDTSEQDEINLETNESSSLEIVERLAAIEEELKHSNQLFESKFLYDATKEDVINKMHKELQGYKDDLLKKIQKPVFMDMIVFSDNMKSLVSRYEEIPEQEVLLEKYQKLRKEFLKIGSHIDDFLYNHGVEAYSAEVGDEFNPRTQQAKKSTDTDNPDEHKKIIASLSAGYTWDEQLLRRENVHVSLYKQE